MLGFLMSRWSVVKYRLVSKNTVWFPDDSISCHLARAIHDPTSKYTQLIRPGRDYGGAGCHGLSDTSLYTVNKNI